MKRQNLSRLSLVAFAAVFACGSSLAVACSDSSAVKEDLDSGPRPLPTSTSGPLVDAGDGGPSDCFVNPKTHFEIINACTNATKITKNPTLSKLLPDGAVPPLE